MAIVGFYRKDADLSVSGNVKASAGTVCSDAIDLGEVDSLGLRKEDFEFNVYFPAATTTHFPANTSCTFSLESSDASDFSTGVVTHRTSAVTGGTAYGGLSFRFKPSEKGERYWRVKAVSAVTGSGTIGSTAASLVFGIDYLA